MHRSLTQALLASALTLSLTGHAAAQATDYWESDDQSVMNVTFTAVADDNSAITSRLGPDESLTSVVSANSSTRSIGAQQLNPVGFTLGTAGTVAAYTDVQTITSGTNATATVDIDYINQGARAADASSPLPAVEAAPTDVAATTADAPYIVDKQNYVADASGNSVVINRSIDQSDQLIQASPVSDATNTDANVQLSSNQSIENATGATFDALATFSGHFQANEIVDAGADGDIATPDDNFVSGGERTSLSVVAQARGNSYLLDAPGGGIQDLTDTDGNPTTENALVGGGKIEIDNQASVANQLSATTIVDFTNFEPVIFKTTATATGQPDQADLVSATAQSIGNSFSTGKTTAGQPVATDASGNDITDAKGNDVFIEHADYLNTAFSSTADGSRINVTQDTNNGFDGAASLTATIGGRIGDGSAPDVRLSARSYGNTVSIGYNGSELHRDEDGELDAYGDAARVSGNLNVTTDQGFVGTAASNFVVTSDDFNNDYDPAVNGAVDKYAYSNVAAGNNLSFDPAFDHATTGAEKFNVKGTQSFTQNVYAGAAATAAAPTSVAVDTDVNSAATVVNTDGTPELASVHNVATVAYGSNINYTARSTSTIGALDNDGNTITAGFADSTTAPLVMNATIAQGTKDSDGNDSVGVINITANYTATLGQAVSNYTASSNALFNSASVNAGTTTADGAAANKDYRGGDLTVTQIAKTSDTTDGITIRARTEVLRSGTDALVGTPVATSRFALRASAVGNDLRHIVPRGGLETTYTARATQELSNATVVASVRNTLPQNGGSSIVSISAMGNSFVSSR